MMETNSYLAIVYKEQGRWPAAAKVARIFKTRLQSHLQSSANPNPKTPIPPFLLETTVKAARLPSLAGPQSNLRDGSAYIYERNVLKHLPISGFRCATVRSALMFLLSDRTLPWGFSSCLGPDPDRVDRARLRDIEKISSTK